MPYESAIDVFDVPPPVVTVEPVISTSTVPLPPPLPPLPPIVMSALIKAPALVPLAEPPLPPPPPIDWATMAGAAMPCVLMDESVMLTVTLSLLPPLPPAPPIARLTNEIESCVD